MNKDEVIIYMPAILIATALTIYTIVSQEYESIEFLIYIYSGILLLIFFWKWIDYWTKIKIENERKHGT